MRTYKINMRRYYYGPRETVMEKLSDETGQPWRGTHAEAVTEIIRRLDADQYILANGESSPATYRIALA